MKCNIFYMTEYRDIFVILLRKFDETKQSRIFLKDLIETTHLFLRMIENFTKTNSHLVVQRKKKKIVRRKRNSKDDKADGKSKMTEEELADSWDDVSSELSAILQGRVEPPHDVTPFDAASEVKVDEQRASAMHRIQRALREKRAAEAVSLFRAAREVWSDGEFGSADISPEDEFMALREVFFTPLPGADVDTNTQNPLEETQDDVYAEEFEQQEEDRYVYSEQEFNFKEFVKRFCQPHIVKSYITLLSGYKENSVHTNHCIIKMLHRIAVDLQLTGMVFQASLFRIMEKILTDPGSNIKQFEELRTFSKFVVRKFVEVAPPNPKVFVELFFWSTVRESVEVVQGYGTYTNQVKTLWTEEQDEELRQLYEEYKDRHEEGMDVVDHIMLNMIDQTKTRRQVIRQLVHLDLINSAKELKKKTSVTRKHYVREWREEEELELRQLFEEYKTSLDPIGDIIAHMLHPRTKNKIIEKLMELGLVSDRKQLYKKRTRQAEKGNKKRNSKKQDDVDMSVEESFDKEKARPASDDDDDGENEHQGTAYTEDSDDDSYDEDDDDDDMPLFVKKINHIVKRCYEDGLQSSVQWIRQCLQRVADDKDDPDDDFDEAVPIVPVLDEQEEAMENDTIKRLLKRCGIKPPDNIQERFWRIPVGMTSADLRVRVQALAPPGENVCQPKTSAGGRSQILKDLLQKKKQALANRRQQNMEKRQRQLEATTEPEADLNSQRRPNSNRSFGGGDQSQDQAGQSRDLASQSDGGSQQSQPSSQPISGKRKRSRIQRSLDSDSEQSNTDEDQVTLMTDRSNQTVDKKERGQATKRVRLLESDSDSDTEKENIPKDSLSKQKALESYDSDVDDKISRNHSRTGCVIESDSDE